MASSSNIRAFTMLVDSISRLDIHDETYVSCLVNTFPQLAPSGCTNTVRLTQPTISLARRIKNGSVDVSVPSTALGILASGLLCEHHQDQAKEFALDPSPRTFRTAVQVMLQAMSAAPAGAAHSMPERSSAPATAAPPRVAVPTPVGHHSTGSLTVPRREWPVGVVKPRPVEGECGICLLQLVGDEAKQAQWIDKDGDEYYEIESEYDFEYSLYPFEFDYDVAMLVWCRGYCGTNFHRRCMERWIDTFESDVCPTCPNCRREWDE